LWGGTSLLNQPQAGDTHISGKISTGTNVDIKIKDKKIASTAGLKDGTFTAAVDALNPGDQVEVDQTGTSTVIGTATVPQTGGVCDDKAQGPCMDQPAKGATHITGKASSGQPSR